MSARAVRGMAEVTRPRAWRQEEKDECPNECPQPFDQVYVGEARKAALERCLPPFLRPIYETACGLRRPGANSLTSPDPKDDSALARKPPPQERPTIRGKSFLPETPESPRGN